MYSFDRVTLAGRQKGIVGVFPCRDAAGQALDRLVLSGFPLAQIFLIGEATSYGGRSPGIVQGKELLHQVPVNDVTGLSESFTRAFMRGGVLGGVGGLLLGLGVAVLTGAGSAILGSAIAASALIGSSACAATGGVIGALVNLGISEKQARECALQIAKGNYLLIVAGTKTDIFRAERLLQGQGLSAAGES